MKVHTIPCTGEAHGNAFIDSCGMCMGHQWGLLIVPAECETVDEWREVAVTKEYMRAQNKWKRDYEACRQALVEAYNRDAKITYNAHNLAIACANALSK